MKRVYFLILIVFALGFTAITNAQSKSFLDMTEKEKADFVTGKIDEITVKISGKKYPFDNNFKLLVSNYLESYAKRVGNNIKSNKFGQDLNIVLQRGSEFAPAINKEFDKNGISRLSGLYIAMIESEFNQNIASPVGGYGLFQIDSLRSKKYGLPIKERANVEKTADLTARYLKANQKVFEENGMKVFLAILSWNRDVKKIKYDVNMMFMDDYRACSICGLAQNPNRFDKQFQTEAFKYIPKFLAAAIVGENPESFGLTTKPLSTL
ncbi:MAG TPA: transglycosylase SLT domain-containing protein [Pyrinomonadaceae bacterium]|nr:transglycosylase SLT domain-containing protein [Pyrinomonadaceae bacterium]